MLTRAQVAVFRALERPRPLGELGATVRLSKGGLSKTVAALARQGLAARGPSKNAPVERTTTPHALALGELLGKFPRQPWELLLTRGALVLLAWMTTRKSVEGEPGNPVARSMAAFEHKPRTPTQLARATGYDRKHIHVLLRKLAHAGVVTKGPEGYALNSQHGVLRAFVEAYWSHQNHATARAVAPEGRLLWERGPEFLLQSRDPVAAPGYVPTSVDAMARHGLPLTSAWHYAYRTRRKLSTADQVVHTFLSGPTSTTFVAYACLFHARARPADLLEVAEVYDVALPLRLVRDYVEGRGALRGRPFPAWTDFESLARDYGVAL